jgi:16S rRNA (cytidine1402-2'-O)-methyltransferase
MAEGILYLIATPIGNLEDITLRALRILKEVDLVAAEDTRHSRKLFNHYGIETPLTSFFQHNEAVKGERIVDLLRQGKSVGLISDAGTPAISDPGYLLVCRCREEGLPITSIPGPSAVVTALSMAGLPVSRFAFDGFLPAKSGARREMLAGLKGETQRTVAYYEAPHRLLATLSDLHDVLGAGRGVAVARELTKIHEELFRGSAGEALDHFGSGRVRGEIVLMVAPADVEPPQETVREALRRVQLETGLSKRDVVKRVARQFGLSGSDVYRENLAMEAEEGAVGQTEDSGYR